jgi:hypothetical protein
VYAGLPEKKTAIMAVFRYARMGFISEKYYFAIIYDKR